MSAVPNLRDYFKNSPLLKKIPTLTLKCACTTAQGAYTTTKIACTTAQCACTTAEDACTTTQGAYTTGEMASPTANKHHEAYRVRLKINIFHGGKSQLTSPKEKVLSLFDEISLTIRPRLRRRYFVR